MSKAIQGIAEIGGAVAATIATGGIFAPVAFMESGSLMGTLSAGLLMSGVSSEMGAIANALQQNRGADITTRQPAGFRNVVYGEQRIGGTLIYQSTTGSHHDQYNMVIVLASHEIDSIEALYLDGRKVFFQAGSQGQKASPGGVAFGGYADSNDHIGPNGLHYNFGSLVYCEARFGNQAEGDVIGGLTANDPTWIADANGNSPWVGGCAYVYLKVEFDTAMFPNRPEIRFTIKGKNDILDPRTGTKGYTTNSALIVADIITDPVWGLNDNTVNQDQLIAAANVCDEQVTLASGSTESRYCCHWHYESNMSAGDAITMALKSCGGRLSRIGGEWYIWPRYWQGPSFTCDESILAGRVSWTPHKSLPELFNRVNGTYTAANYPYNVAGDLYDSNGYYDGTMQDNFNFAFQQQSYPQYAADELHGYGTGVDVYLTQDGGIPLPKELDLPCVLSVSQAQRLAKIALLWNRQQGKGVIPMSLAAFGLQPTDVIQFTFGPYGWTNKELEVEDVRFRMHTQAGHAPMFWMEVKVSETSQSIDEWAVTEELTPYDVPFKNSGVPYTVPAPTNLTIEDDSTTVQTLADGTTVPRLLVSWTPPNDVYVNNGGKIEVQYQYVTSAGKPQPAILTPTLDSVTGVYNSAWVDAGAVSGDSTFMFIDGISTLEYQNINVQVRAVRANGAVSAWVAVDNHPLQVKYPKWPIFGSGGTPSGPILTYGVGGPTIFDLQPAEAGADKTSNNVAKDTSAVNGVASSTVTSDISTALSNAASALTTANGKAEVTVATSAPSSPKNGDIWYNTSSTPAAALVWNGSAWVAADAAAQAQASNAATAAADASALAGTKAKVTIGSSAPSSPNVGDVWVNTSGGVQTVETYNGSGWAVSADITSQNTAKDTNLVNGVASHLISPISTLMPAQAGADKTSSNQSASTATLSNHSQDDLGDGSAYVRLAKSNASGNVAYNFKGAWSSTTSYNVGDEVLYSGGYWIATASNTNANPQSSTSWTAVSQAHILQHKALATAVSVSGGVKTEIDSITITLPDGGPWWVRVDYFYAKNGGVGFIGWIQDSLGNKFAASQGVTINNNSAISASGPATVSYTGGQTITFAAYILDEGNATITLTTLGEGSSPVNTVDIPSFMQIEVQSAPN